MHSYIHVNSFIHVMNFIHVIPFFCPFIRSSVRRRAFIAADEIEAGCGPVMSAHLQWHRMLATARDASKGGGNADKADRYEKLLGRIRQWRNTAAKELRMAPASVLPEHVMLNIAYVRCSDVASLQAAGVQPITLGNKYLWPAAGWFDYLNMRLNGPLFHLNLTSGRVAMTDARVLEVLRVWDRDLLAPGFFGI